MGANKRPIYRFVAIDSRRARNGRFVDMLGHYSPIEKPAKVIVNEEKIYKWLKEGAEPSDTVSSLFSQIGLNQKWELLKQGKDASEIELKTVITERKKRTKKVKAAIAAEEAAAETKPATEEAPAEAKPATEEAPAEAKPATEEVPAEAKPAAEEAPAEAKPAAEAPAEEAGEEKTEE